MNYISKNLRFLRKRSNLTQEQFAVKVSMNRGNIASYEKGSAEPSIEKLQRITQHFNVDLNYFIEKDLEMLQKERDNHLNFTVKTASNSTANPESIDEMLETAQQNFAELNNDMQDDHLKKILQNNTEVSNFQVITLQNINNSLHKLSTDFDEMKSLVKEIVELNRSHLEKS